MTNDAAPDISRERRLSPFLVVSLMIHALGIVAGAYIVLQSPADVSAPADRISLGLRSARAGAVAQPESAETAPAAEPQPVPEPEADPEPETEPPSPRPVTDRGKQPLPDPQVTEEPPRDKKPPKIARASQQEATPETPAQQMTDGNAGIDGSETSAPDANETGEANEAGALSLEQTYDALVLKAFKAAKRYPSRAKRIGLEGDAEIVFTLSRNGEVIEAQVIAASSPLFERAALAQLRRAAPFPPAPDEVDWQQRTYRIRVPYILEETSS